ncbi:hypothetical protein K6T82_15940 [Flavobacterium sp. 17A]|uniref:TonB-dependent Receptor Plug Domain n=1 Tax=Flavobacterium potami TaxID=2872310 RepID=A0A9X1KR79_9FLAO|nr:hypothetical protein [Flavobacterium potami]MBZ4036265.1 hypothetical protein [Flavobacterium potami]
MEKLKYILLLILIINTKQIKAQQDVSLNETLFIHANATTFVSGETLLYKIYCLKTSDKTPSAISKIAYAELVDANSNVVFKNKLFLNNGTAAADYFIPTTIKTGNYKLIGYTNWTLNSSASKVFQIDIKIINPYEVYEVSSSKDKNAVPKTNSENTTAITASSVNKEQLLDKNFKLKLNKKTFANREKVVLEIAPASTDSQKGNYSLSVRKIDNLPTTEQLTADEFSKTQFAIEAISKNKENIILPELRGEMISGKIIAKNNSVSIQNVNIALSLPGKSFAFKVVKTDQNGHFIFNLDKNYAGNETVLQVLGEQKESFTIELDKLNEPDYTKLSFQPGFRLPIEFKEALLERSIASQIENAYYLEKTDSIIKPEKIDPFYYPLSKQYNLDDFTRFPTLKETITEIAIEISSKQSGNNHSLHVVDYSTKFQSPEPALVLIDGFLLQNVNELFTYNMNNVHSINIITGGYYVGPKIFNGIISITTNDGNYTSPQKENYIYKMAVLRPSMKKSYYKTDYTDNKKYERIPDFRSQLLWNPEIDLSNSNPVTFYTSDLSGTYEISVEGFTDKGNPVSIKDTFKIE